MTFTIPGIPIGKPRMTRRDKWKQRPCVLAYRSWADSARAAFGKTEKVVLTQPTTLSIVAYFSIPASWSTYKKERAKNIPHTVKPDFDNCIKAVADALFHNDQMICNAWCRKLYDDGRGPRIEVTLDAMDERVAWREGQVEIVPAADGSGYGVRVFNRMYHGYNEAQAVAEREWWLGHLRTVADARPVEGNTMAGGLPESQKSTEPLKCWPSQNIHCEKSHKLHAQVTELLAEVGQLKRSIELKNKIIEAL